VALLSVIRISRTGCDIANRDSSGIRTDIFENHNRKKREQAYDGTTILVGLDISFLRTPDIFFIVRRIGALFISPGMAHCSSRYCNMLFALGLVDSPD
jgi:hypothetical protein